jgi:hypothetical protein
MTAVLFCVITRTRGKMRVNFHFKKVKCRSHLVHKDANECSVMYGSYSCVTSRLSIAVHVSKLQIKCIKMLNSIHICTSPIFCHLRHDYFGCFCCLKYTASASLHELKVRCPFTRLISGSTAFDGFQLDVFWLYGSRSSSS